MDALVSASQAARQLGTSVPRITRAIQTLKLDVARDPGGRLRLRPRELTQLKRHLGSTPPVSGLSRTEVKTLAALARAPRGLVSDRAVAARAGASPTAAGRALRSLVELGLVSHEPQVIAAGSAREFPVYRLKASNPDWLAIAQVVLRTTPVPDQPPRAKRVPPRLHHLFWNTAPGQLDVATHGGYIARRLLTSGDGEGLAWGRAHLASSDWKHAAKARGLEPDQRALAHNLAASRA